MSSRCMPFLLAQFFLQKPQELEVPVPPPGAITGVPTPPAPPPPPAFQLSGGNVSPPPGPAL